MIPYGKQDIQKEDIQAVIDVLNSDFLTQGPVVENFENAISRKVSSKYAFAVNSATSALHLGCIAMGLSPDDTVWTTPITFVASANCARYCGANIDFVDINIESINLCPVKFNEKLAWAKSNNKLPKILIVTHMGGLPCEMEKIYELAKEHNIGIIEDASHAIGAKYNNDYIGNSKYSDLTIFSFHPVKIITTGEGGMLLTNNDQIAQRVRLLRTHGITRNLDEMLDQSQGPWYYEQHDLGFNYRMTEIQSALGLSQLNRLDEYVSKRNNLSDIYDSAFQSSPVHIVPKFDHLYSSKHLYLIRIDISKTNVSRDALFNNLRNEGIGVNVHYIPVHLQPYYRKLGFKHGDFPDAEKYYAEAISLPLHVNLSSSEQEFIIETVKRLIV